MSSNSIERSMEFKSSSNINIVCRCGNENPLSNSRREVRGMVKGVAGLDTSRVGQEVLGVEVLGPGADQGGKIHWEPP